MASQIVFRTGAGLYARTLIVRTNNRGGYGGITDTASAVFGSIPPRSSVDTVNPALNQITIPPQVSGAVDATPTPGTVAAVASVPAPSVQQFEPTDITGCTGWWDFSDASTLYEQTALVNPVDVDGDSILSVADKSGVGSTHRLDQTVSSGNAPLYKTGIINGLSVARFDGANDFLHSVSADWDDTSWTMFIVAKKRSAVAAATDILFQTGLPEAQLSTDSAISTGYNWALDDPGSDVLLGGTPTDVNIIALHITSAAAMKVYLNGGTLPPASFDPSDEATTATDLIFGATITGTQAGDYDLGEIVRYDTALSVDDIDLVGEYLADKWGTTWTPHAIPEGVAGLKGWWDASEIDGLWQNVARDTPITTDGQTVASWDDRSGANHHLMQNFSTVQEPSYETAIINGLSALRFDGIDNFLMNDSVPFAADTSFTVFILARKNSAVSSASDVLFAIDGATDIAMLYTDNSFAADDYLWYSIEAIGNQNVGGTPTSVNILVLRIASASSMNIRVNGGSGTTFDPNNRVTVGTQYIVGVGSTVATHFGDYDVGEIISYDTALSDADINTIGEYLADKWGPTWTTVGVVNETVTPATVAAVVSVPAPTIQAAARVAPATVAAVVSVPAPTIRGGAITTPATVAAVASVPAPTVRGTAIVAPSTVAAVAAVPAPTLRSHQLVAPATVAAIAAVPAPTIVTIGDAITTPATVAAAAAVPAPSVQAGAIVVPATVAAIASVPAPTVSGTARVTPATVAAIASVPAPTVSATALVAPATVAAVASVPAPTVRGTAIVSAVTVAAVAQVPAPALLVGGDVAIVPATVAAIVSVPAPTIGYSTLVAPSTVAAIASVPAPTVVAGVIAIVSPATVAAVASVPAPTLSGAARVTPATVLAVALVPAPTIAGAARVAPATVVAIVSVPAPTIRGAAQVAPATVAAIVLIPAPTVIAAGGVVVTPLTVAAIVEISAPTALGEFVVVRPELVSRPLGHYGGTSPFRLKSPSRRVRR